MRTGASLAGRLCTIGGTALEVKEVSTEEEVRAVSPVVLQLRTHPGEEELVSAVGRMRREGYRLIAAYDDGGGEPVEAAGFRVHEMHFREGMTIYNFHFAKAF